MLRLAALLLLVAGLGCATVPSPALLNPALAQATGPQEYTVKLVTSRGSVLVDVDRSWAPQGADRFYNLVESGYFDGNYFFRTIAGFMSQVGLHGDPEVTAVWRDAVIPDDPVTQSNTRGSLTFATAGPGTRTTQVFINLKDNLFLDSQGFAPFARVRSMKVVDKLWVGYGESRSQGGLGPEQPDIVAKGNEYLESEFPKLDQIIRATVIRRR